MNPLNRKMFRQPGMSRQPAGILASSPELSNVVRQRMGQPVQMANGGQNVTNYMSAIKDLAAKGDKATLNNIARDQRLPRSVQMAAANALTGRTVPGQIQTAPVPDADRMTANRANLGALRGQVGQDALTDQAMAQINAANRPSEPPVTFAERGIQGPPNMDAMGDVNTSTDDAMQAAMQANVDTSGPSLIDRGIAAVRNAIPDAKGYADPPSTTLTPRGIKDRGALAMGLEDDPNLRSELQKNIDASISERLTNPLNYRAAQDEFGNIAPDGTMPGETLASTATPTTTPTTTPTDGIPRKVSTVNPKTTTAVQKLNDNLANVKGDVFNPEDQKNLTANEATNPEVVEEFTFKTADLIDPKSVDLEDIDKVARDTMGFDPKAAGKKKEEAFWMGLMKAGLAIAAGGSENAMTNIAKGLSYGLDSYSKDIATLNEQERADRKEFRQLKTQMIRDERSYNLTIAGIKNTHAQSKVAAENQFKKNKIDIGFKRADAIRQDQRIANEQAYKEATLEADTLYKIRLMEQGDEKIQISKEALESKSFKTFKDAKVVDKKGEPTALGLEIYETPQGVAEAMINNDLRTTIKLTDKDKDAASIKEQYGLTDAQARIVAATQSTLLKDYGNFEAAIKALGFNKPAAPQKVVVDPSQLKSK